jgi:hypothetical protein
MLQEHVSTQESEASPPPASGGTKPLPNVTRAGDGNPSLLPDAPYFALLRLREAEAKATVRQSYREIARQLLSRLRWPR